PCTRRLYGSVETAARRMSFSHPTDTAGEFVAATYGRGEPASMSVPIRLTIDPAGIRQQYPPWGFVLMPCPPQLPVLASPHRTRPIADCGRLSAESYEGGARWPQPRGRPSGGSTGTRSSR